LVRQFHALCSVEFTEEELEEEDVWLQSIFPSSEDGGEEPFGYHVTIALALRPTGDDVAHPSEAAHKRWVEAHSAATDGALSAYTVLGGAMMEFYAKCSSALMPYIVVDAAARGLGVAGTLLRTGAASLDAACKEQGAAGPTLRELFIEVSQRRHGNPSDPHHTTEMASLRQAVWSRCGFLPLDTEFVHPGRLRGQPYQLAVYRPAAAPGGERGTPFVPAREVVYPFLRAMFDGIHAFEERRRRERHAASGVSEPFKPLTQAERDAAADAWLAAALAAHPSGDIPIGPDLWH
jgi:GNAT superfamily N-acetyltransferase